MSNFYVINELYESSHYNGWISKINKYDEAVDLVAIRKNKPELVQLDKWLWNDLKINVYDRYNENKTDGYYLTKDELSNIMRWKLIRGKFRPLQKMVDGNSEDNVKLYTGNALDILCNDKKKLYGDWKKALKELTTLKGIGVATASIILAVFLPEICPFMSDEVLIAANNCKLDYTIKAYINIQQELEKKAQKINSKRANGLSAEILGKALWTVVALNN